MLLVFGVLAHISKIKSLLFFAGTGKKGGMLSIFLMGCFDKISKLWKTVTKVHSGLDDKTMEDLKACMVLFFFLFLYILTQVLCYTKYT